jgi:adenosylcobinamide-GDP ribazoletransferase
MYLRSFTETYYIALFFMPAVARWAVIPAIFHARSARRDGLGNIFIENTGPKEIIIASSFVIGCWLLTAEIQLFPVIPPILLVLPLIYMFSFLSAKFFNKKLGGMTGDNLGAVSEISELIFLIMVVAWL